MISPFVVFATVFGTAFVLQFLIPSDRVLLAAVTTVLPVAATFLTVWWRNWDRDALWIIGFAMVVLECAVASVLGAVAAEYAKRLQQR